MKRFVLCVLMSLISTIALQAEDQGMSFLSSWYLIEDEIYALPQITYRNRPDLDTYFSLDLRPVSYLYQVTNSSYPLLDYMGIQTALYLDYERPLSFSTEYEAPVLELRLKGIANFFDSDFLTLASLEYSWFNESLGYERTAFSTDTKVPVAIEGRRYFTNLLALADGNVHDNTQPLVGAQVTLGTQGGQFLDESSFLSNRHMLHLAVERDSDDTLYIRPEVHSTFQVSSYCNEDSYSMALARLGLIGANLLDRGGDYLDTMVLDCSALYRSRSPIGPFNLELYGAAAYRTQFAEASGAFQLEYSTELSYPISEQTTLLSRVVDYISSGGPTWSPELALGVEQRITDRLEVELIAKYDVSENETVLFTRATLL